MRRWMIVLLGMTLLAANTAAAQETEQPVERDVELDVEAIESVLGLKGTEQDGEYKVTVPQNDLDVSVDGFRIIPPMGLGTWAAFTPTVRGAMVMGDIVVRSDEILPVQQVLIQHGLTPTAVHNHFVREDPDVMYMHIDGMADEEALALAIRAVFDRVAELRGVDPSMGAAVSVPNTLDTARIADILGHEGEMSRGVYKITIGRPDVDLTSRGTRVTTFMGFNTWAAWQGTPENAAVAGDFVMH